MAHALRLGFRVVELDVWPPYAGSSAAEGAQAAEPIVLHGHTLTKSCAFRECVAAVRANAFVTSPYPVIITLENHCKDAALQQAMADILSEELGEALFVPPDTNSDLCADKAQTLLSPEALKGKILIRDKPAAEKAESKDANDGADALQKRQSVTQRASKGAQAAAESATKAARGAAEGATRAVGKAVAVVGKTAGAAARSDSQRRESEAAQEALKEIGGDVKQEEESVIVEGSLKRLIYVRNEKFKDFQHAERTDYVTSSSFSEHKLKKILTGKYSPDEAAAAASGDEPEQQEQAAAADMLAYSRRHIARTYPGGEHVDSSNYDPTEAWCVGVQVAALNVQGRDRPLWRNQGKFLANGATGYVLKPSYMLDAESGWTPHNPGPPRLRLDVRVVRLSGYKGGWGLEKTPDLFVKLEMSGVPADWSQQKTKIRHNTREPEFGEDFSFYLSAPELAVLTLCVKEYDILQNDFMGQVALPAVELREGSHTLPLLGRKGLPSERFGAPMIELVVSKAHLQASVDGAARAPASPALITSNPVAFLTSDDERAARRPSWTDKKKAPGCISGCSLS